MADHPFPLISGHLSLDLVNTEVVRHGTRHDLLRSVEDVVTWVEVMQEQHVLHPEQFRVPVMEWADTAYPLIKETRAFLREGFEKMADEGILREGWTRHLEYLIAKAPFSYFISENRLLPVPLGNPPDVLAALAAFDAAGLLTTKQLMSMHRCANPECVLLFMDTSGRRKWCSMQICGNRKKVSRYQRRKKKQDIGQD